MLVERDERLEEILLKASTSLEFYLRMFLPERFYDNFGHRQHKRLFEVLDDKAVQKVCVVGHRGIGKTSMMNYGYPSREVLFNNLSFEGGHLGTVPKPREHFIVPISATNTGAVMQAENLKRELSSNNHFQALIGDIRSDELFAKDCWITSSDVMVLPRGSEQQIRGSLYKNERPRLIISDDLEKSDQVLSKEQRVKVKDWFFSDVLNSVDRRKNDYRVIIAGTILHEDALLIDLRDDPTWTVVDLPLCDESYKSYWPTFMPDERVEELVEEFRAQGKLDVFYREYMNKPIAAEDAVFRQEYFQTYEEEELDLNKDPNVDNFVIIDPAKTEKVHNADSAIIGCAVNMETNSIYFRDCVAGHYHPDQIYDEAFKMADRLGAHVIGFEVTGLNEFIVQPMRSEMLRRGRSYELVELKARKGEGDYEVKGASKGKAARVAMLAPYYRLRKVYHNPAVSAQLESQLLQFPRAKRWDVMDAFSYVIEMMELGDRYFSEEKMADDLSDEEKQLEREYRRLDEEDAPAGIGAACC